MHFISDWFYLLLVSMLTYLSIFALMFLYFIYTNLYKRQHTTYCFKNREETFTNKLEKIVFKLINNQELNALEWRNFGLALVNFAFHLIFYCVIFIMFNTQFFKLTCFIITISTVLHILSLFVISPLFSLAFLYELAFLLLLIPVINIYFYYNAIILSYLSLLALLLIWYLVSTRSISRYKFFWINCLIYIFFFLIQTKLYQIFAIDINHFILEFNITGARLYSNVIVTEELKTYMSAVNDLSHEHLNAIQAELAEDHFKVKKYKFRIFVKAMKILAFSITVLPLLGCSVATGFMFSSFIRGVGYAPDMEDTLFSLTMMGFALVETFMVLTFLIIGVIYSF